uniref:PB1-like domain-containing protein n=1 Tax=Chenopodium quinoa TaxID=63459 RepID=A0A803MTA1_CHEQI
MDSDIDIEELELEKDVGSCVGVQGKSELAKYLEDDREVNPAGMGKITLKMWHGGAFEFGNNGQLRYRNGEMRTFSIDPDELCSFYLVGLVMNCARYDGRIKGFLYLVPGLSMVDGSRKVTEDQSMRDMIEVAEKNRGSSSSTATPLPTLSAAIAASDTQADPVHSYEWEDSRPDSPIPINDLIPDFSTDSDHEDPRYNPLVDKGMGVISKPFFEEVYTMQSDEDVESDGE